MVFWCLGAYLVGLFFCLDQWVAGGVLLAGLIIFTYRTWQEEKIITTALILLFLGAGVYQMHQALVKEQPGAFLSQAAVHQGTVIEGPRRVAKDQDSERLRYRISLSTGKHVYLDVKQRLNGPTISPGSEIAVSGSIQPLHFYHNDAGYEGTSILERKNLVGVIRAEPSGITVLKQGEAFWFNLIRYVRQAMIQQIQQAMPLEQAAVLTGILLGGYEGIPPEWTKDFAKTGLVHLLSVSGSHVSLVCGMTALFCRKLKLKTWGIFIISLGVLLFYATLAGWSAPVVRSVIMGIIALGALTAERPHSGIQALAWSVLVMLLYEPIWLEDLSFCLSVGSTGGIVLFYQKTQNFIKERTGLPELAAQSLSITWVAQLGVLPVIANQFYQLSFSSFIANLTVGPILEGLLLLTLLGCLSGFLLTFLGKVLLIICSFILQISLQLVHLLSQIPGILLPNFSEAFTVFYYGFLFFLYGYFDRFRFLSESRTNRIIAVIGLLMVASIWLQAKQTHDFSIHFIDVGQGEAILVQTPHGKNILIDAGPADRSSSAVFDLGERIVVPYLKKQGVEQIQEFILTHAHDDHAGGAKAVAEAFAINRIWFCGGEAQTLQALRSQARPQEWRKAEVSEVVEQDQVKIEIHPVKTQNEWANVIVVRYGNWSFLLTGDLEEEGEAELLRQGLGQADVLKVGHHGSKTSSSVPFLQRVKPKYAIISVGANNRFGHPHAEVLQRLKSFDCQIYRTDLHGAIVFHLSSDNFAIDTIQKLPPQ